MYVSIYICICIYVLLYYYTPSSTRAKQEDYIYIASPPLSPLPVFMHLLFDSLVLPRHGSMVKYTHFYFFQLHSLSFILSPSQSFSLCFSLSLSVRQSLHQLKVEVSNTISIDTSFHLMRRLQTSLLVVLCGITYLPFTYTDTLSRTLPLLHTNKSTLTLSLTR